MRSPIERRTRTGSPAAAGLGRIAAAARAALPWAKTRRVSVMGHLGNGALEIGASGLLSLAGATGEIETALGLVIAVGSPRQRELDRKDDRQDQHRGLCLVELAGDELG